MCFFPVIVQEAYVTSSDDPSMIEESPMTFITCSMREESLGSFT